MPPKNILVILVVAVFSLACYSVASKSRYANLFAEAMDVVNREALRPVDKEQLFVGAMNGMLKDLDEYSMYIAGDQFRSFDEDLRQEFGGVGMYVEIDPKSKMLMVLAPMPGTPAYEADMQVGDLIVSIAGEPTLGKQRVDAVKELRGPIGERVELEVKRGDQTMIKQLTRARIPIESVHGDYRKADGRWTFALKDHPDIGYIRLSQFGDKSSDEVRSALEEIGPQVGGLILDLRGNPGGLLHVATDICDMFLPADKLIVETKGRKNRVEGRVFSTKAMAIRQSLPVCILIDRYAASASEVVAGCLQDHDRGILIGEQSYGKGTVQDLIPIQRNQSALKLTTQSYWRPSGKNIDRYEEESKQTGVWGVQPNEGFRIDLSKEEVLQNFLRRSARDIEGLASGAEQLLSEIRTEQNGASESAGDESPQEQSTGDNSDAPGPGGVAGDEQGSDSANESAEPHVDRPLQKAIEYLLSQGQRQVAA